MFVLTVFLVLILIIISFYKWATIGFLKFEKNGIPYEKPWPLVGNCLPLLLRKESLFNIILRIYQQSKKHKIFGVYHFRQPSYIIKDPSLIKKITINDFDYFRNHKTFFDNVNDKLLENMLIIMKDQRWKDMRNTLTPIFTAAKMRAMFPLVNECCLTSIENLKFLTNGKSYDFEMKEYFARWSNDVIASTAFGLKINSYVDKNNEFFIFGTMITNFKGIKCIRFLIYNALPKLMKFLKIYLINKKMTNYFIRLINEIMKLRKETNFLRPDVIQLLMMAKKNNISENMNWSDEEIFAQCFIFFFAAFENNSNLITLTCHELMLNSDIQKKLYDEVLSIKKTLKEGLLTYDAIQNMKYMNMVVLEILRKWPSPLMERACTSDYILTDDNGKFIVKIEKGDRILIPIVGMHYDEKHFPNPNIFDPERFNTKNKEHIKPFTYIPFGIGQRNCIGIRYTMMVCKAMLYHIVLNFEFNLSPKTSKNLREDIVGLNMNAKNGFWSKISLRKNY